MLALVAAGLLLLAAPDEDAARKLLRVAYASLYEWREDKVENATFDFACTVLVEGRKPEDRRQWRAAGTVVVAGGEIARVHIEGANRDRLDEIRPEVEWMLTRFVREPFEERFKEAKLNGPEKRADGEAVAVGSETWILKNDRVIAFERNVGTEEKPFRIRIDARTGDCGGGYAVLGETASYKRENLAIEDSRTLTIAPHEGVPVPQRIVHVAKFGLGTTTKEIVLSSPRLNATDPVVLEPAARDRVQAAWAARYRIPRDVRIDGRWEREPGRATTKGGWQRDARGDFQYIRRELTVLVSDDLRVRETIRESFKKYGTEHIGAALALVLDRPFEEEFKGCGFRADAEDPAVVHLVGHPRWLAVRIQDGAITGHLEDAFGGPDWWEYRHKKARDGRLLVDRMTRRVDGRKWHVKIAYAREKDFHVPKSFEILVPAQPWDRNADSKDVAILEYSFRKLDVIPPGE